MTTGAQASPPLTSGNAVKGDPSKPKSLMEFPATAPDTGSGPESIIELLNTEAPTAVEWDVGEEAEGTSAAPIADPVYITGVTAGSPTTPALDCAWTSCKEITLRLKIQIIKITDFHTFLIVY